MEFEFGDDLDNPRIRRIIAGVAIEIIDSDTGIGTLRYQHKDHLGSTVALSTSGGQLLTRMHFDPWGQRQDISGELWNQWATGQPEWANVMLNITPRGFTGHEHLDDHGIIHMNGRIYDPHLGRFLQADPFIEDTGTLNRYTYVHNNPLAYSDPSGFFGIKDFLKTAAVVAISVYTGGLAQAAVLAGNVAAGLGYAVAGGAIAGAISSGSIEGALWGAFSAAVFFGIGQHFTLAAEANSQFAELGWINPSSLGQNTGLTASQFAAQSVSHAIAGGTLSVIRGGQFGHGFFSAGVSKAATPGVMGLSRNPVARGALVSIVGGTASKISGGKFANGATSAAMAFAFNQIPSAVPKKGDFVDGLPVLNDRENPSDVLIPDGLGGRIWVSQAYAMDSIGAQQSGTTLSEYTTTTDEEISALLTVGSIFTGGGAVVAFSLRAVKIGGALARASGAATVADFAINSSGQTASRLALDGVTIMRTFAAPPPVQAIMHAGNVFYDTLLFFGARNAENE